MSGDVLTSVIERGDLAHLALLLWAAATTSLAGLLLRELTLSNRRFQDFVAEIARVNRLLNHSVKRFDDDAKAFGQGLEETHSLVARQSPVEAAKRGKREER